MKFALYNLNTKELNYCKDYEDALNQYMNMFLTTSNRYIFLKSVRIAWIENNKIVQLDYMEIKSNSKLIDLPE